MTTKSWHVHYPESFDTDIPAIDFSIPHMLQQTASGYPEHPCISFYQKRMTYRELQDSVTMFSSSLQHIGTKKGDRVAIMLPNCPQYVISYYGILTTGGIVTQVNPMSVERELIHLLNDSGAETIMVLDRFYPIIQSIQKETKVKTIIVVSFQGEDHETDYTFDEFLKLGDGRISPISIDPEDVAVLQYTGGTTGVSKGVMLTHSNILSNVMQSQRFFKESIQTGEERSLSVIPFFHVFGMNSCMNLSIYTANEMILLPRFELSEVLSTIKREKPTLFPGVPTMYVAITNHPSAEEYGIHSIKLCNSGSAPMPVELLNQFEKKTGAKILEGYGLSEASPTTHCNPAFAERKPGTVGIGLPSTDYKVVDIATGMKEVPPGDIGELIIKGPQVMKGYWNLPEETANALRDGWLYTGDIARMDDEGYVSIVDRKKDMIIASGYNVYPREVEEVIYEHPSVQEAVVIGVPDSYRGETVKAVIVLKAGEKVSEQELMGFCQENMSSFKVPRIIEFRDELPKTSVGKILRRALRENVI
ncbi:long-chain-fatty-acid--CoA ligase [Rossellomorea vietnamensis]|uniref:long-chain-fatty-acid--CoA ligase n=1 Tax=Rossellomorea vietnamensis TaxID=218284 RepID=UPI001E506989|nr:long-chain fatty acid--CoA ligase [Rossellomorea vietnamensis]